MQAIISVMNMTTIVMTLSHIIFPIVYKSHFHENYAIRVNTIL